MITDTEMHNKKVDLNEEITLKMTLKDLLFLSAVVGSCPSNRIQNGISYRGATTKFTNEADYLNLLGDTEQELTETAHTLDHILYKHGFSLADFLMPC